ncbi:MutS-related protein [Nocardia stercoris]|nr:DNA mismatch repair protein [Nocardia stercoris]
MMRFDLLAPAGPAATAPVAAAAETAADLGLDALYQAMAEQDPVVLEAVRAVLPLSLTDAAVIRYRQQVLADCLAHPDAIRELYEIACRATGIRRYTVGRSRRSNGMLRLALQPMTELIATLRTLREACDRHRARFDSAGLNELTGSLAAVLTDDYLHRVDTQLAALEFDHGLRFGATLGPGGTLTGLTLYDPPPPPARRRLGFDRARPQSFTAPETAEPGTDPLTQLKDRALTTVAATVSHAADRIQDFFTRLRDQLAFYIGCLTLHRRLTAAGVPVCLPVVHPAGAPRLNCTGLREPGLCLSTPDPANTVTGNDIDADGRSFLIVTGANNGGKSTFLRSVGYAQLMMQAGMFVTADHFEADVRAGVFTHFAAGEDRALTHGKLAEELARMSHLVDTLHPNSLLLCNESFAATGDRDATTIATDLFAALTTAGVKIVLVTHLTAYAHARHTLADPGDLFLRAARATDGHRSHRLTPGAPEPTAHATDLLRTVFPDGRG